MAIYGSLKTMELGDILQWLYLRGKTGVLLLKSGDYEKKLAIREGKLRYGTSENPKERLGPYLRKFAGVPEKELKSAIKLSKDQNISLGAAIVSTGIMSKEKVNEILTRLIEEIVYNSFVDSEGYFRFEEREEEIPFEVNVEVQELLLEGYERKDELSEIKKYIPSMDIKFTVIREPEDNDEFISLIKDGKTLKQISDKLQMVDFDVLKKAHELVQTGVLKKAGEASEEVMKERTSFLQLKAGAEAFYREGRLRESLSLYEKLLELDPGDMETANRIEEINRIMKMGEVDGKDVPKLKIQGDEFQNLELSPQEGFVVSRINGAWNISQIVKLCPFPEETTKGIIKILIARGIVGI